MKRRARVSRQERVVRPLGSRPAPLCLACSLIALASTGVLCVAGNAAFAAGTVARGTVPTAANYTGGTNVGTISTIGTATGQWTTIQQTKPTATANFNKFDIAAGSGVTVGQADATYRMLLRVNDTNRTTIEGMLNANGQVYLLNRNGILFGQGAQVNVGALFASTLNIKDEDFLKGFDGSSSGVKNFTRFDLFTDPATKQPLPSAAIEIADGATLTAASSGAIVLIAPAIANNGLIVAPDGQVILAAGKTVYLWQRSTNSGAANASALRGLMVEITAGDQSINLSELATNSVKNTGTITADRGNVSIAALAINQNGIVSAGSSVVSNGSIWLTARSIATPTGSAMYNDRDDNRPVDDTMPGKIEFGAGSFTGTPLLTDSGRLSHSDSYSAFTTINEKGAADTRDFRSWIHIVANKIHSAGNIVAPGGVIEMYARGAGSRILLDNGSLLSAAGDWVDKQISDNIVNITRLTSNELKDAPLQRSGPLLGAAISFDARTGSPIFDTSAYIANRQETVQDKATIGGKIDIQATQGDFIAAKGSTIDVSGGGFRYAGGGYTTTKLIGEDGKVYDIGSASPLRKYVGTTDGISRVYQKAGPAGWYHVVTYKTGSKNTPTTESAYVDGADAGSLSIIAPNIVRLGDWYGGVTMGRYQVSQTDPTKVPQGGTLTIGDSNSTTGTSSLENIYRFGSATDLPSNFGLLTALPAALTDNIILPADEFGYAGWQPETYSYTGFGKLALYADKSITVPAGVEVKLPPGGSLVATTLKNTGTNITLEAAHDGLAAGSISAPAGYVSLNSGNVILGSGARIDASGMVMAEGRDAVGLPAAGGFTARGGDSLSDYVIKNVATLAEDMALAKDRPAGAVAAPRFAINAASSSINIDAANVTVGDGTTLSAMGGFSVGADNSITAGNGGAITLPYTGTGTPGASGAPPVPVGVKLYGYSLAKGAKLTVDSNQSARVGGYAIAPSFLAADGATGDLLVAPGFFSKGGFSDYTLTSGGQRLSIDPGTQITLAAEGLQVKLSSLARRPNAVSTGLDQSPASGGDAGINLAVAGGAGNETVVADLTVREKGAGERSPTSVHFKLSGANGSALSFGENAEIHADPGATVEFSGSGLSYGATMDLLGHVWTPGGNINASMGVSKLTLAQTGFDPLHPDADTQSGLLHIGADAILSTAADFVPLVGGSNAFGTVRAADGSIWVQQRRQGYVTSGGSVSLNAKNARIITDASSKMDVSATSATVDLPSSNVGGPYVATRIWGDAGSISIASTEASRLDGKLLGNAAGQGLGGSFSLSFVRHEATNPETDREDFAHRIVVSQGTPDHNERFVTGSVPYVTSRIAADTLNAGGFANVTLKSDNSIEFVGPVQLATTQGLTLDAPILDVVIPQSGQGVKLASDHLTLTNTSGGNPWAYRNAVLPVPSVATHIGAGILEGDARMIDLMGSVTVNGVQGGTDATTGEENRGLVLKSSGDIRLTGLPVKQGTDPNQIVDSLSGRLTAAGNIELRAQQVYGTTLSQYTVASQQVVDADPTQSGVNQAVTDSGTIRISQAAGKPQPVLSAGSKLTLKGDQIIQDGTLKAPMGSIAMSAHNISFEPGSLTSVSLDGQTVPLGETLDGRTWYYYLSSSNPGAPVSDYTSNQWYSTTLSSPGDKQIVVNGDSVNVKPGSTIDLSGGGDVQAFEFVAGPGGSRDVLQTSASAPTWAILPSMRLSDAPVDTHLAARNGGTAATRSGYNTIYISGVAGLADGYYPLLDAHYALLPGAYQISALTAANKSQLVGAAATTYKNDISSSAYSDQVAALAKGTYSGKDLPLGQDVPVGRVGTLLDGTTVISAWRGVAGSDVHEARTSGYIVRSGSAARQYSQLDLTTSDFFASKAEAAGTLAPRLPTDAGGLTLNPRSDLTLAGTLKAKPGSGGRAAEVDISADLLAVVKQPGVDAATEQVLAAQLTDLPGTKFVEISTDSLAGLDGSVLLGGSRKADGTLSTNARRVVVATDAASPLRAAEVMLAAKDQVTVMDGAVIQADLPGTTTRSAYTTTGDGALLRASSDGPMTLDRTGSTMTGGTLDVRAGAQVIGNSILADATGTTRIDGTLRVGKVTNGVRAGGSLSMAAKSVALGETAGFDARGGLVIDNTKLATLNALDNLTIHSYSSIDLVGNANVGGVLRGLTLDAGELAGYQAVGNPSANAATIAATTVTLRNGSGSTVSAVTPNGNGTLDINADRVVLAKGDKGIRGFGQVNVAAATELAQSGTGTIKVAAATTVTTPRVVASSGADQTLAAASRDGTVQYALDVSRPATVAASRNAETAATPGGRWAFSGKSVSFGSTLDAPAGTVEMAAKGTDSGDVIVKAGAAINAHGYTKHFTDADAYASAGNVTMTSDNGGITVEKNAAIDIAAESGGGDAGKLTATAAKGTVDIAGNVSGSAANGAQGSINVDAKTIAHFTELNGSLNAGGLTGERIYRQRAGNLIVDAGKTVKASHVSMAADAGSLDVNGTVDASGDTGGRVELYAKNDLNLNAGSLIDAHGTGTGTQAADAYSKGGTVELVAETGTLSFRPATTDLPAATVDISAGAKGDAGSVTFAAARDATGNWVHAPPLAGTVKGLHGDGYAAPHIILRGDKSYDFAADFSAGTDPGAASNDPATTANFAGTKVYTEYTDFAKNADILRNAAVATLNTILAASDTPAKVVSAAAGIELTGTDMTVNSALDLTDRPTATNWSVKTASGSTVSGVFTLRAAGNLDIKNTIGLTDYIGLGYGGGDIPMDWLPKGESWSLKLVGGADLAAANPLALQANSVLNGKGNVTIRDDGTGTDIGKVRTGSGTIDIAAGNNFVIGGVGNQAVVYSAGIAQETATDPDSRYTSGGGDIRIRVQGDATGSLKPTSTASTSKGEFINDWLRRTTATTEAVGSPTGGWWGWRPLFRQDIASFGGGNITLEVGGNLSNMGVMSPSSGRANVDTDPSVTPVATPALVVRGGGDVKVTAAQDIVGGEILLGLGKGTVRAGRDIGTEDARTALFVMGLGSDMARNGASMRLEAGGNVVLQNISNPTMLASTAPVNDGYALFWNGTGIPEYGFGKQRTAFFTYAAQSSTDVVSVTGNVELGSAAAAKPQGYYEDGTLGSEYVLNTDWSSVAPPRLTIAALTGNISQRKEGATTKPIDLFPASEGGFKALAGGSIIDMSLRDLNIDPSLLPAWNRPVQGQGQWVPGSGTSGAETSVLFPALFGNYLYAGPRLATGNAPSAAPRFVIEAAADLTGATVITPAATTVRAGRDIKGAVLEIQNETANDVSVVAAGRDIVQDAQYYHGDRLPDGSVYTTLPRIYFGGPGAGVVEAGRNVDLGDSKGIVADGNTRNASLHDTTSSRLVVLGGVQGAVELGAVDALTTAVKLFGIMELGSSAAMAREAKAAIAGADSSKTATLDSLDAVFATLSTAGRTKDIRDAATAARDALAAARAAALKTGRTDIVDSLLAGLSQMSAVDTKDGKAVNTTAAEVTKAFSDVVFAKNKTGPGSIDLFKTQIQTTGGSGIDLLAPGFGANGKPAGFVNVGLPSGGVKNPFIGILTQAGGAINAYVTGDFNVNQSKVLTVKSDAKVISDIMLYSSDGGIDAGRGALTSRSSSPPRKVALYTTDTPPVFIGYVFLPPIDVAGSGIRTVSSVKLSIEQQPNVYLFAPKGTINAGEAGIDSAGNITIRAVQVLNANAISAAGTSSGVPQATPAPIGALGAGPTPGTKNDDLMKNLPPPGYGNKDDSRPRILMVEVLGVGDSEEIRIERKADDKKCGKRSTGDCNESEM